MDLEYVGQAPPEAYKVVGFENPDFVRFQSNVVDEGAVLASEVMEHVLLANTCDLSMSSRDGWITDR